MVTLVTLPYKKEITWLQKSYFMARLVFSGPSLSPGLSFLSLPPIFTSELGTAYWSGKLSGDSSRVAVRSSTPFLLHAKRRTGCPPLTPSFTCAPSVVQVFQRRAADSVTENDLTFTSYKLPRMFISNVNFKGTLYYS